MFAGVLRVILVVMAAVCACPQAVGGERRSIFVANPREIEEAMKSAGPGDRLIMKNGVWENARLRLRGEGTAESPITLAAETPGKVVLTGSSSLAIGGRRLVVEGLLFQDDRPSADKASPVIAFRIDSKTLAYDCRLTNCAILDFSPPDKQKDTRWVSLYGSRNRVDHCALVNKTNLGATLIVWLQAPPAGEPNYHRIDHNVFGLRPAQGKNGAETIRIGDSDTSMLNSRTLVESNYFFRCSGEAEIISNKSCENVYRGNTFVECEGALTLRHGNRCLVEGNFFLGNGARLTGGVRVIGEDHKVINNYFADLEGDGAKSTLTFMQGIKDSALSGYFQVKNALVAFNTFVNNKHTFNFAEGAGNSDQTMPPVDCVVANNLVVGRRSPLVKIHDPKTEIAFVNNIMYGADLGLPDSAGIIQVDPGLQQAPGGLWRPGPQSPAVDAAQGVYPDAATDMDGQRRLGKLDVGADERSDEPPQRRPLTRGDVGPSWLRTATGRFP